MPRGELKPAFNLEFSSSGGFGGGFQIEPTRKEVGKAGGGRGEGWGEVGRGRSGRQYGRRGENNGARKKRNAQTKMEKYSKGGSSCRVRYKNQTVAGVVMALAPKKKRAWQGAPEGQMV